MFFGNSQAENAHFGQFLDDLHRDQLIIQVPFVGKRLDLFNGEAAELIADHFKLFVQTAGAESGVGGLLLHQLDKT